MGLSYTWKLTGLKKQNTNDVNDVVIGTQWKVYGTDVDGNEAFFTGATPFHLNTLNTGSFIDYQNLTEETVLGWIKNVVSGSGASNYMEHINEQLHKDIDSKKWIKLDVNEENLPWSPTSGSNTLPGSGEPAPL